MKYACTVPLPICVPLLVLSLLVYPKAVYGAHHQVESNAANKDL